MKDALDRPLWKGAHCLSLMSACVYLCAYLRLALWQLLEVGPCMPHRRNLHQLHKLVKGDEVQGTVHW